MGQRAAVSELVISCSFSSLLRRPRVHHFHVSYDPAVLSPHARNSLTLSSCVSHLALDLGPSLMPTGSGHSSTLSLTPPSRGGPRVLRSSALAHASHLSSLRCLLFPPPPQHPSLEHIHQSRTSSSAHQSAMRAHSPSPSPPLPIDPTKDASPSLAHELDLQLDKDNVESKLFSGLTADSLTTYQKKSILVRSVVHFNYFGLACPTSSDEVESSCASLHFALLSSGRRDRSTTSSTDRMRMGSGGWGDIRSVFLSPPPYTHPPAPTHTSNTGARARRGRGKGGGVRAKGEGRRSSERQAENELTRSAFCLVVSTGFASASGASSSSAGTSPLPIPTS